MLNNDMEKFVINLLLENLPGTYFYHNHQHTLYVMANAERIGSHEGVTEKEMQLIKAAALFEPQDSNCLEQPQSADGVGVCGVFRGLKAYRDMALSSQVVDFSWLGLLYDPYQVRAVGHVSIMEVEARIPDMGILINIFDPRGIKGRGPPLHAVDLITLIKQ